MMKAENWLDWLGWRHRLAGLPELPERSVLFLSVLVRILRMTPHPFHRINCMMRISRLGGGIFVLESPGSELLIGDSCEL